MQVLYQLSYTPKGPKILTPMGTHNFAPEALSRKDLWAVSGTGWIRSSPIVTSMFLAKHVLSRIKIRDLTPIAALSALSYRRSNFYSSVETDMAHSRKMTHSGVRISRQGQSEGLNYVHS